MNYDDIEAAILKGFVQDQHLITHVLDWGFTPDLLRNPNAGRLCDAILALHASGAELVDLAAVRRQLGTMGLLSAGMEQYLQSMVTLRTPDAGRLMERVALLRKRDSRERLQALHERLARFLDETGAPQDDISELTSHAIQELMDLQRRRGHTRLRPASHILAGLTEELERPPQPGRLLGFSLAPFERLSAALSGLRPGFYYGLAGAPRRGKTNFALQLAAYVAANHGIPVLFYSWEQTSRVLAARLVAKEAGIDPATILTGCTADGQPVSQPVQAVQRRMAAYMPYLFLVESGRRDTLGSIRTQAYNIMQQFKTGSVALFFDYLQKIPPGESVQDWNGRTDMISTQLAELSLELNVPVFAISPLDKDGCRLDEKPVEEEKGCSPFDRPTMHHSVGSGDLEYDLDVAMVLAKDWQATGELRQLCETEARAAGSDPDALPQVDIIDLFIDKNRDAPESASYIIQYAFFVTLNKFVELDYKLEKEYQPEFHTFRKLQNIYGQLREAGYLAAPGAGTCAARAEPLRGARVSPERGAAEVVGAGAAGRR